MKADGHRLSRALARQDRKMKFEALDNGAKGQAKNGDTLTVTLGEDGVWQAVRVVGGVAHKASAEFAMLAVIKASSLALEAARG